jgi:hypothetical protein
MWSLGATTASPSTRSCPLHEVLPPHVPRLVAVPYGLHAQPCAALSQLLPCRLSPQRPRNQLLCLPSTRPHPCSYRTTQKIMQSEHSNPRALGLEILG